MGPSVARSMGAALVRAVPHDVSSPHKRFDLSIGTMQDYDRNPWHGPWHGVRCTGGVVRGECVAPSIAQRGGKSPQTQPVALWHSGAAISHPLPCSKCGANPANGGGGGGFSATLPRAMVTIDPGPTWATETMGYEP